jgi:hypothetical protein
VPLERSSSLLAGIVAAFILNSGWGLPAPTGVELVGAALLILAILLLYIAPRATAQSSPGVRGTRPENG